MVQNFISALPREDRNISQKLRFWQIRPYGPSRNRRPRNGIVAVLIGDSLHDIQFDFVDADDVYG